MARGPVTAFVLPATVFAMAGAAFVLGAEALVAANPDSVANPIRRAIEMHAAGSFFLPGNGCIRKCFIRQRVAAGLIKATTSMIASTFSDSSEALVLAGSKLMFCTRM